MGKVIEHIDRHTKQIEKDNNSLKNIEIRSLEIKQSLDMLHVSLDRDALAREFQEDINWMNDSFDIALSNHKNSGLSLKNVLNTIQQLIRFMENQKISTEIINSTKEKEQKVRQILEVKPLPTPVFDSVRDIKKIIFQEYESPLGSIVSTVVERDEEINDRNKTEAPNFGQQDLDIKFGTGVNEGTPTETLKRNKIRLNEIKQKMDKVNRYHEINRVYISDNARINSLEKDIKSAREKFDSFVEKLTEIEALYLDGEEETIAANRAFEKVITNLQILHIETSIAVEKYNTLRADISLKLRQMRAQKNKSLLFLYRFLIGRVLLLVAGFFHYFHLIQVCTNLQILHIETSIAVEKYNTLRADISLKLRQMRAQKNKSENKDKKETNDTEEDSESQTLPLIYNESKKPQDDTVNSHTPESDENNEKTQQQGSVSCYSFFFSI
jgi:hypothetical protein